jgi:hypothetical protein
MTRLGPTDRFRRYGHRFADRRIRRLLRLLHAAMRDLLAAPGGAAAVPHRRGNRDGGT